MADVRDESVAGVNAWLTCSTTTETVGAIAGVVRNSMRAPTAASTENGIRNLTEAATHTQCRTRAEFFRKANVTKPATPANSVDCHR